MLDAAWQQQAGSLVGMEACIADRDVKLSFEDKEQLVVLLVDMAGWLAAASLTRLQQHKPLLSLQTAHQNAYQAAEIPHRVLIAGLPDKYLHITISCGRVQRRC